MTLAHIDTGWFASALGAIVFEILFPLLLAFVISRRLKVGWRYFLYGALVFFVCQLILRVPAVQVIQTVIAPQLQTSPALLWGWLFILALTAGLFEEVGRYLGYRIFMRNEEKTWNKAVMYGTGHGGIESILLVAGLGALTLVNLFLLPTLNLSSLPADQQKQIVDQFGAIASQPGWLPLLGAYERLCAITFQIAMSVVVLQVFRRGQIRWLWLAVFAHFAFDLAAIGVAQGLPLLGVTNATLVTLAAEGVVTIGALLALWIIVALRDRPSGPMPVGESPVAPLQTAMV
ncbi:MAG TPA: YhfC family glutamic-type intramembrane protease [Ktedonobacterales bacterium]|jgi:uncharacterized membrane protein YhfC